MFKTLTTISNNLCIPSCRLGCFHAGPGSDHSPFALGASCRHCRSPDPPPCAQPRRIDIHPPDSCSHPSQTFATSRIEEFTLLKGPVQKSRECDWESSGGILRLQCPRCNLRHFHPRAYFSSGLCLQVVVASTLPSLKMFSKY